MRDPDPGHSTTSAEAVDTPGATETFISVILHADITGKPERGTLIADMRKAARAALDVARVPRAQISLVITGDEEMRALNRRFRGIDKPTNVLSFPEPADTPHPDQDEAPFLGEVVVSLDTLLHEAAQQGKRFPAHATHLVVHGVLHLLGYTHDAEEDAARMEALEAAALARLGIPDPYAETQLMES